MIIDKTLAVIGICIWWAFTAFSGGFIGYCLGYKKGRVFWTLFHDKQQETWLRFDKKLEENRVAREARWAAKDAIKAKADLNTPIADAQQAY